jgi:hypothetical protein
MRVHLLDDFLQRPLMFGLSGGHDWRRFDRCVLPAGIAVQERHGEPGYVAVIFQLLAGSVRDARKTPDTRADGDSPCRIVRPTSAMTVRNEVARDAGTKLVTAIERRLMLDKPVCAIDIPAA